MAATTRAGGPGSSRSSSADGGSEAPLYLRVVNQVLDILPASVEAVASHLSVRQRITGRYFSGQMVPECVKVLRGYNSGAGDEKWQQLAHRIGGIMAAEEGRVPDPDLVPALTMDESGFTTEAPWGARCSVAWKLVVVGVLGRGIASQVTALELTELNDWETAVVLCDSLSRNRVLKFLDVRGRSSFCASEAGAQLLGAMLRRNVCLQSLLLETVGMRAQACSHIADAMLVNSSVTKLSVRDQNFIEEGGMEGVQGLARMIMENKTLTTLEIWHSGLTLDGAKCIVDALVQNTALQCLEVNAGSVPGVNDVFARALTPAEEPADSPCNTTLKEFRAWEGGIYDATSIAAMIRRNRILTSLTLGNTPFDEAGWCGQIIPALRSNSTLEKLDLQSCRGVSGDKVFKALMGLAACGTTALTEINLQSTPLRLKDGNAEKIGEELRLNREYRAALRDERRVQPKTSRLVLCGFEYAGKTTLGRTMGRIMSGNRSALESVASIGKRMLQNNPCLWHLLYGTEADKELSERTRGIDVQLLRENTTGQRKIVLWDFAGQKEYYALHDYTFPSYVKNGCFLFVFSPIFAPNHPRKGQLKGSRDLYNEFSYWLRFISSNTKRPLDAPRVYFVLTRKDKLAGNAGIVGDAKNIVRQLRDQFKGVLDVYAEKVFVVDGEATHDVAPLLDEVASYVDDLTKGFTEYAVCSTVLGSLQDWATKNNFKPIMRMQQYDEICQALSDAGSTFLASRAGKRTVASYLNNVGEIIYAEKHDFIIVNPRWFVHGVLGHLIQTFAAPTDITLSGQGLIGYCLGARKQGSHRDQLRPDHENGLVSREDVNEVLKDSLESVNLSNQVTTEELIQLMLALELGYEQDPGNPDSLLFIPAIFDDHDENALHGFEKLVWMTTREDKERLIYVGRRLTCHDTATTFLTPGFFPRLQVVFRNTLPTPWISNLQVRRNLVSLGHDGIDVFVEYSGDQGYFVDLLVRSSKTHAETLKVMDHELIAKIRSFCASPQGCQGVSLTEHVIRPLCVKTLSLCAQRHDQSVATSELVQALGENWENHGYMHRWNPIGGQRPGPTYELALDLLHGRGTSLPAEFKSVSFKADYIGPEMPRLCYLDTSDIRSLEIWILTCELPVTPVKLHLMCEWKDCPHLVQGQAGRTLLLENMGSIRCVSLLKYGLALLRELSASPGRSILGGKVPLSKSTLQAFLKRRQIDVDSQAIQELAHDCGLQRDNLREWFSNFLRVEEIKFRRDFGLWRGHYIAPGYEDQMAWVCREHLEEGVRENILMGQDVARTVEALIEERGTLPPNPAPLNFSTESAYPNTRVQAGHRRGMALIISIDKDRPGEQEDRGLLQGLARALHFETEVLVNVTQSRLRGIVEHMSQWSCLEDDDSFLCCVNAHGFTGRDGNPFIYVPSADTDGKMLAGKGGEQRPDDIVSVIDEILQPFRTSRHLARKPKVFLINACRGKDTSKEPPFRSAESGPSTSKDEAVSDVLTAEGFQADAGPSSTQAKRRSQSSVTDCLIVSSTVAGLPSYRDERRGTNFVKAVVEACLPGCYESDVASVFTIMTDILQSMVVPIYNEQGKLTRREWQCPEIKSTLTKKLYWCHPQQLPQQEIRNNSRYTTYAKPQPGGGDLLS